MVNNNKSVTFGGPEGVEHISVYLNLNLNFNGQLNDQFYAYFELTHILLFAKSWPWIIQLQLHFWLSSAERARVLRPNWI